MPRAFVGGINLVERPVDVSSACNSGAGCDAPEDQALRDIAATLVHAAPNGAEFARRVQVRNGGSIRIEDFCFGIANGSTVGVEECGTA